MRRYHLKALTSGAAMGVAIGLGFGMASWTVYVLYATWHYSGLQGFQQLSQVAQSLLFGGLVAFSVWGWYLLPASAVGAIVSVWKAGRPR